LREYFSAPAADRVTRELDDLTDGEKQAIEDYKFKYHGDRAAVPKTPGDKAVFQAAFCEKALPCSAFLKRHT